MKKGFTLIEIVICICLITITAVGSIVGIKLVDKKIKINKLEQMNDKILLAADVYISKHPDVQNAVNNKGAIIPLNTLKNEGLVDLDGIIDKNDDDYILALLGGTGAGEECQNTYIEGSWTIGSKTIYICTKDNGNGSSSINLSMIQPNTNYLKASNQPYYFKGSEPNNYFRITYKDKVDEYRIIYIDSDDSIVATKEAYSYTHSYSKDTEFYKLICDGYNNNDGSSCIKAYIGLTSINYRENSWIYETILKLSWAESYSIYRFVDSCKITSGTGAKDKPFTVNCG